MTRLAYEQEIMSEFIEKEMHNGKSQSLRIFTLESSPIFTS
jgi:hypothetical protein